MINLVPAQFRHINRIAARIRPHDREECEAMGRTPKEALRLAIRTSEVAWTALVDGQPEAMFGLVVENAIGGEGTPWFLGSEEVYRHGREMLMHGPAMLARMRDSTPRLRNLVSARNARAIRMLRRWGFTVGDEETMIRGVPFLQFEMAS